VCVSEWDEKGKRGEGWRERFGQACWQERDALCSLPDAPLWEDQRLRDDITFSKPCTEITFLSCVDVFSFETAVRIRNIENVCKKITSCLWQVMVGESLLFKRASDRTEICVVQHEKSTFLVCFGGRRKMI